MPKKTKKQKIIAEYRRKIDTITAVHDSKPKEEDAKMSQVAYQLTSKHVLPQEKNEFQSPIDNDSFRAIKKDLVTTLILVAVMLISEIVIWQLVG